MEPQKPGITPVGSLELRELNRVITAIRQRLDGADRRSVANPATADQILALQRQLAQLQAQLTSTVNSMNNATPAERNLVIDTIEPVVTEPTLWLRPVYDVDGLVTDLSVILRTP